MEIVRFIRSLLVVWRGIDVPEELSFRVPNIEKRKWCDNNRTLRVLNKNYQRFICITTI